MIGSKELNLTVIKQTVTSREKVWVVETRLNEERVIDSRRTSLSPPSDHVS